MVSHATADGVIHLDGRDHGTFAPSRFFLDPRAGLGLMHFIGGILHEAWHSATTIGHNTFNPDGVGAWDSSFAYGGAWVAQYYYFLWLATHSRNLLSPLEKEYAMGSAQQALANICAVPGTSPSGTACCRLNELRQWRAC